MYRCSEMPTSLGEPLSPAALKIVLLHIISLYIAAVESTAAGKSMEINIYSIVLEPTCKNLHIGHDTARRIFDVWAKHAFQHQVRCQQSLQHQSPPQHSLS